MASVIEPHVKTRRLRRVEYDRLVDLGMFVVEVADSSLRLDRRLKGGLYARAGLQDYWVVNLAEGVLEVHRDPQPEADAPYGWVYRSVEILRPPALVAPLAAPGTRIPVADLLP
jgi:Uma2 family endonuclease